MPINSSRSPESAIRKRTPRTIDDVIQRPSEPEEESRFLTSRKNKWGIGAAAAVIGIHLVAGLGFLWPVVAAATYGATALLTPPEKLRRFLYLRRKTASRSSRQSSMPNCDE